MVATQRCQGLVWTRIGRQTCSSRRTACA
ncbi:hypothetical protein AHiyo6_22920, partial [Arthrobacter sp. Hiyo6]